MSVRFCDAAPHGFHNFTGRARVCSWCQHDRKSLEQAERETAAAYLDKAKKANLTPERIAELDAMRPYVERRKRYTQQLAAITNVAAFQFDALPAPVPADVRAEVAAAVAALQKAVAAVSNSELREMLYLSLCIADAQGAAMQSLWEAKQQRRAAA